MDFSAFSFCCAATPCLARTCRAAALVWLAAFPAVAFAQWSSLPGVNNAIVVDSSIYPQEVAMISDGAGGAIFVWRDGRVSNSDYNLYAQRLDANGARQWGDNGVAVCDLPGSAWSHQIISDGAGGVLIEWYDERPVNGSPTHHLYVQRLNSAGQALWTPNGILLRQNASPGSPGYDSPLLADGTGGFYVVTFAQSNWPPPEPGTRIFRLNGSGQVVTGWPATGLQVPDGVRVNGIVSDQPENTTGEHGVLLGLRYSVRKIAADGILGFSTDIYTYFGTYNVQAMCSDGLGGMFVVTGSNADLFVFRVKADGTLAWPENNRRVVITGGWVTGYDDIEAVTDGAGGVIVTWFGYPASGATTLRMAAQRISPTGERLWGDNGVDVYPPNNNSYAGEAVSDGAGGVIVSWGVPNPGQVRAQRLDANGTKLWSADGVLISEPYGVTQLVTDQASGAVYSVLINSGGATINFGAKRTTLTGSLGSNSPLARLINISSRAQVGTGDDVLIPGFVVTGGSTQLLVRGIGPTLASFNVTGALADPQLTLYTSANQIVSTNDDWGLASNASDIATVAGQVGAFALPGGSKDSSLLVTLQPGLYTAVMRGVSNGTGVGLVEMYEVGGAANAGRLANMSVRARVGTGDNILIPGIVVGGSEARTLLIRAVGPTLNTLFGVGGVLADPQITLFNQGGTQLAVNDNWGTPNGTQISSFGGQVGAFALPAGSKDAAFLITLSPGIYTAQVSGVNNTTGVCLVEVYEVP